MGSFDLLRGNVQAGSAGSSLVGQWVRTQRIPGERGKQEAPWVLGRRLEVESTTETQQVVKLLIAIAKIGSKLWVGAGVWKRGTSDWGVWDEWTSVNVRGGGETRLTGKRIR